MLQCFNSVSNNETDVTLKVVALFCPTATYMLLTYADVVRCYGMTMFVDVCLARLTSHADSVRTLPSEINSKLLMQLFVIIYHDFWYICI